MLQGEIWYADLNPTKGSEQSGFRLVVIISGNLLNNNMKVVICIPLTIKIKDFKGGLVLNPDKKNNLTQISEILTFHVRSLAKERLVRKIGIIDKKQTEFLIMNLNKILKY